MRSSFIKKFIASSLIFSMTIAIGGMLNSPKSVQAYDIYEITNINDIDDVKIVKEKLSISGMYDYLGEHAVSISLPSGINIKDVTINGFEDLYDDIEEVIFDNNLVLYGFDSGVNYENLSIKIEDTNNVDYVYDINSFVIEVTNQSSTSNNNNSGSVNTPQSQQKTIESYLKNVYKNVFGREVDQQGLNYWTSKLLNKQIMLKDFFKNLLSENEFLRVAPTPENKIKKLYAGIFQRTPDEKGFNYWVRRYEMELDKTRNEKKALINIIDDMTNSSEFRGILSKLGVK